MDRANDKSVRCCCGSGLPTKDIYEEGTFVARVCDKCKVKKLAYESQIGILDKKDSLHD